MNSQDYLAGFGLIALLWGVMCLLSHDISRYTARLLLKHANGVQSFWSGVWAALVAYRTAAIAPLGYEALDGQTVSVREALDYGDLEVKPITLPSVPAPPTARIRRPTDKNPADKS